MRGRAGTPSFAIPRPWCGRRAVLQRRRAASVTVDWTKATDDSTAQAALEYLVYYSASDDIDTVANAEANGTAVGAYAADIATEAVSGLVPSTTYYFNVLVRDGDGNRAACASSSQATLVDTTDPVPGNSGTLTTSSVAETSLDLS